MSTSTSTQYAVSIEDFRAIELEPIGYPLPAHDPRSVHRRPDATQAHDEAENAAESLTSAEILPISRWKATVIIGTVACVGLINSMLAGILVVSLPTMAGDLGLSKALLLWPASVNSLAWFVDQFFLQFFFR
jgi:hypothetical protein